MPKFPERQSSLIKKAEDTEADTAEQSAIKLRTQQQASNALAVTDQPSANGTPPVSHLGLVKVPSMTNTALNLLLPNLSIIWVRFVGIAPNAEDALALAPVEEQTATVQVLLLSNFGNIAERFHALILKDSGILYEDPYIQIGIKAEWRAHHGRLVLFLGNKNTAPLVSVQALILPPSHLRIELSLVPDTIPPRAQRCGFLTSHIILGHSWSMLNFDFPAILNKSFFLLYQYLRRVFSAVEITIWATTDSRSGIGVRPVSFGNGRLVQQFTLDGLSGFTAFSPTVRAMLCLVRIETDQADRTQLRMTVASGDPTLTFELKEFIKEQLVNILQLSCSTTSSSPTSANLSTSTSIRPRGAACCCRTSNLLLQTPLHSKVNNDGGSIYHMFHNKDQGMVLYVNTSYKELQQADTVLIAGSCLTQDSCSAFLSRNIDDVSAAALLKVVDESPPSMSQDHQMQHPVQQELAFLLYEELCFLKKEWITQKKISDQSHSL
ncbi:hypothetical protein HAX54_052257 [Datura stramonium]|uniref:Clathrin adaptor alpha/beta/gamma-adaptin appendage Ig-like subdomain domain-containing protein n=1 Tax=Datura stramonium TaxID=4076 RepID=A0ABS8SZQ4_DATST|nr:hypothetical protein [Datura stramonium]